jgi:hypothetical protein
MGLGAEQQLGIENLEVGIRNLCLLPISFDKTIFLHAYK